MELRHLRYFVAVAEKLNFSEAAKTVHITQPSLSQQIQDLERDMGVELIERSNRQIRLTPAGQTFLTDAQSILGFADKARQKAKLVDNGHIGHLRVGFLYPAAQSFLPALLKSYHTTFPQVNLTLGHYEPADLLKQLQDGQLDVVFTRQYNQRLYPNFTYTVIKQDAFMAVLPQDHPLAGLPEVNIAQLADNPLVLFHRDLAPEFYDQILSQCPDGIYIHPVSSQETYLKAIMLIMVESGMGVGIMPSYVQGLSHNTCQFVPLAGGNHQTDLLMVRRTHGVPNPVIDAFAKLTLDTLLPDETIGTVYPVKALSLAFTADTTVLSESA